MSADAAPEPARNACPRRRWLKRTAWGAAALAAGVVADTFWVEPTWLDVVERELPVADLSRRWHNRTLAQISDIHVGHQVSERFILDSFARVTRLHPDLVVYTGDYVTTAPDGSAPLDQLGRVMREAPRGKFATLGILGNHDYGPTWSDTAKAGEVVEVLGRHGVNVLRNAAADLDGLTVTGLDDLWSGRCDGSSVLTETSASPARIVLCHNPDGADQDFWSGYHGWILSGHTHGGQCKPPFLPPPLLPVKNRRYTCGEFELSGGRRLYINRGLGHLLGVRFNCRPEITIFRLVAT